MDSEETHLFATPCHCPMSDCPVPIIMKGELAIFVCRERLAGLSEYFERMLLGDFKEHYQGYVSIPDIDRSEMLVFLHHALHSQKIDWWDTDLLCSLIALSDRFLCSHLTKKISFGLVRSPCAHNAVAVGKLIALGDRLICGNLDKGIARHIINTPFMRNGTSVEYKLSLVELADGHQGMSTHILDACIGLCANLESQDVDWLEGKVSDQVLGMARARAAEGKRKREAAIERAKKTEPTFTQSSSFYLPSEL